MNEVITPSSHWQGTPVRGSRWTVQQLDVLARERIAVPELVARATVIRRARVNPENWTMPPEAVRVEVPRLALNRAGTRAKIVTPAGAVEWVDITRG